MITRDQILPYIEEKLVSEQAHSENPDVRIYNYTQKCQFSREWNPVTMACRGLILNVATGECLANPFPKFFNLGEGENLTLPKEAPVIRQKYDGSLGILYWLNDVPYIATRGSFTSEQALWATWWLNTFIDTDSLMRGQTYLFEIIYPENKIVIDYNFSGLVLLAIRETRTGHELDMEKFIPILKKDATQSYGANQGDAMRIAGRVPTTDLDALKAMDNKNEEGFVLFYPTSGLRLKVKFPEYVRLHRIVTGVSVKSIWEHLKNGGKDLEPLLTNVPDEFFKWVKETVATLEADYKKILDECSADYFDVAVAMPMASQRRDWALAFQKKKYPAILFKMHDDQPYAELIWKLVKPKADAKTYKVDNDV